MLAYGWTEKQLEAAEMRASDQLGTRIEICNAEVKSENCKRGGQTINFTLRPARSSSRNRDGSYPPGILLRWNGPKKRSSGALCFHAFGHFMRAMFEMNPAGKLKTGYATYDGVEGFEEFYPAVGLVNMGSMFEPIHYQEMCECMIHNRDKF